MSESAAGAATMATIAAVSDGEEPTLLDRLADRLDHLGDQLPQVVELPGWVEPALLRSVAVVAIVVIVVLAFVAARIIRRMVVRLTVVIVLAALAVGIWSQRVELAGCAAECSCALFGQVVQIPADLNPNC
tara:strand:+ start:1063 stop:1455 length:393 start_codon:yes stop_codon:yes gene_type:complete